jgi:3-oxoacyl-[acyl-carrier-protein] synthase-3
MAALGEQCLRSAGVSSEHVSWVPHQANLRIIRETGDRLDIPAERWICYTDDFGNASSATIPVNLWRASREGRLRRGDLLLMTAIGAGLTGAAALIRF